MRHAARHAFFAPTIVVASLLLAVPAAGASERFAAGWEVFWGGLRVASIDGTARLEAERYRLDTVLRSQGLLAWLFDLHIRAHAEGRRGADGALQPERYAYESDWRTHRREVVIDFDRDGGERARVMQPESDDRRAPVPQALRTAPDPVSLLLIASHAAAELAEDGDPGGELGFTSYDGNRAARLRAICPREETLSSGSHGVFEGHALLCLVEGEQTGGFHAEGSGRMEVRQPVRVWLADAADGVMLPVRIEAATSFGRVLVHLTRFETNDPRAAALVGD